MAKLNKLNITGNVVADAIVRNGETKDLVLFSVAVNLPAKEETKGHFFKVETWVDKNSKLPETLKKGTCVSVGGRLLESTKTRQDGTTTKEPYVQASRVDVVKDGWMRHNSEIIVNAFIATPPVARGKTTAVRIGIETQYSKEKKATDVMFMDVIYFGDIAEWVLANRHKGDAMNVSGRLVTNKRTTKDGKNYDVHQILAFEYPDVTRYAKNTEGGAAAPENNVADDSPVVDEDDYNIPF